MLGVVLAQRTRKLADRKALRFLDALGELDGRRHDGCLLDTFVAAVAYAEAARRDRGGRSAASASPPARLSSGQAPTEGGFDVRGGGDGPVSS